MRRYPTRSPGGGGGCLVIVGVLALALVGGLAFADSKIPVCVKADVNADGFVKPDLADPLKDIQKQVKKSKKLFLNCEAPSLTIVVLYRGSRPTGDTSYSYGVISKITKRHMWGRLEFPDGRNMEIVQYEGNISRSWGHLAKKFREQVEDFCELNAVK